MVIFHSYVSVYQRVMREGMNRLYNAILLECLVNLLWSLLPSMGCLKYGNAKQHKAIKGEILCDVLNLDMTSLGGSWAHCGAMIPMGRWWERDVSMIFKQWTPRQPRNQNGDIINRDQRHHGGVPGVRWKASGLHQHFHHLRLESWI